MAFLLQTRGGKGKEEGQEQHEIRTFGSDLTKTDCPKAFEPKNTRLPCTGPGLEWQATTVT